MSTKQEFSLSLKIDTGTCTTIDIRDRHRPVEKTEGRVRYPKRIMPIPTVTVSLSSADASNQHYFRVKVYTNKVGMEGFAVYADSWSDTEITHVECHGWH